MRRSAWPHCSAAGSAPAALSCTPPPAKRSQGGSTMKSVIDPCGADVRFDANDCQTDGALLSAAIMTEQPSFMSRIAGWFRWNRSDDSLPLEKETFALEVKPPARRGWFFQRDSRRDA